MTVKHLLALAVTASVLVGCAAGPQNGASRPAKLQLRADTRLRGTVATVNEPGQFVVVDFSVGTIPPLATRMNVYRGQEIVGQIELTGPARDNLVAGDVVSGSPKVGDEAIWDEEPASPR